MVDVPCSSCRPPRDHLRHPLFQCDIAQGLTTGSGGLLWLSTGKCGFADVLLLLSPADCSEENPCEGLSRHATFTNFGMAFLTLFRVSTGDNWNGIMKVSAASVRVLLLCRFIDTDFKQI